MTNQKLHLHSMMVHAIAALAPLAAVAYIFLKQQVAFLSFDEKTWIFLVVLSVILSFLIVLPSILTGLFERGHIYVKWHPSHQAKLLLSMLLTAMLVVELVMFASGGLADEIFSLTGILIIFGNNIVAFLLCKYGLKLSLGRQSLEKTSYEPDLFAQEPVDILVRAGEMKNEPPKYLDLLTER